MQHDEREDKMFINEHDRITSLKRDSYPRWTSAVIGGIIIGFFAFILFYQDNKLSPVTPNPTPLSPTAVTESPVSALPPSSTVPVATDAAAQPPSNRLAPQSATVAPLNSVSQDSIAKPSVTVSAPAASVSNIAATSKVATIPTQQAAQNESLPAAMPPITEVAKPAVSQAVVIKKMSAPPAPQPTASLVAKQHISHRLPNQARYTIQLLAVTQEKSLRRFIKTHHLQGKVQAYQAMKQGKVWYIATYGGYKNFSEASQAVIHLPEGLKKAQPWPKPVASFKSYVTLRE